jgi:hypothetical protein
LPGEYVVLAENLDPAAPMRKLPLEQQQMVEHRELRVSSVWLTVDSFNDSGVLWSEYEFDGIEGKFRGDAFIDARFAGHATGALLHVDGELWLLPVLGSIQQKPRRFGDPILIDGLERAARHHLLGNFRVEEDAGAAYFDFLRAKDIEPLWGEATFVGGEDRLHLLTFGFWDPVDPEEIPAILDAFENASASLKL